jgi:arsenite methyltransferase
METLKRRDKNAEPVNPLRDAVRERYGDAARRVLDKEGAACCAPATGSSGCCGSSTASWDPITSNLYDEGQAAGVPADALLASLGCGNPTALADLREGETVLDLGSGGGIDVLLSAKRVGPAGKAYGLDMTDEMLAIANANKAAAGATNVEFLKGHIESIPLPDASVDVIISNCVINLSGDKRKTLAEAFRVLKPGGRFAVSDVIVRGAVPADVRRSMELWMGCVAGALEEQQFLTLLRDVGFENASIEPTRIYTAEDASALLAGTGLDVERFSREMEGKFLSGFVRATKPQPTKPLLRPATPSDLPRVQALLTDNKLPLDGVDKALECFVVAEHDGALVGVAGIEHCGAGQHALLRSVAVAESWKGKGLGRALVTRAIGDAEARGAKALYLLTTTAEQYFPSFGFKATTREEVPADVKANVEFTSACPSSAVVMVRESVA